MKISLLEVVNAYNFCENIKNKKIPLKLAYKFNCFINILEKEENFYKEKINRILQTYAEIDEYNNFVLTENGQGIKIKEGKLIECQKEMEELQSLEVTIQDYYFSLEELEVLTMSISEMRSLMPFIKE